MKPERNITSSCLITEGKLIKNGKLIFEQPDASGDFPDQIYSHFEISYPKFHKMDQLCKLGFLATELLLSGENISERYKDDEVGIVLSNSHASLDVDLKYEKTIKSGASPALFVYTLPNIVIGEISIRHRLKGENAFFVFKQFDANFISQYVDTLFENDLVKACLCGWVDYFKNEYRALLMFVEAAGLKSGLPFTPNNMIKLNQQEHG